MKLDLQNFPLVWMRDHEAEEQHDEDEEIAAFEHLLNERMPFAIIVERAPQLPDMTQMDPQDRARRARLFKVHKAEMSRLCVAFIVIVQDTRLPLPIRKAIEGVTSAMGVPLNFASDKLTAEAIARERLRTSAPLAKSS